MVVELNHPLVKHKLSIIRDKKTTHKEFRELINEITMFLAYESLKDVELKDIEIETPLVRTVGKTICNEIIVVPILRAGVGMLDGILNLVPTARVGFLGMYRDHETKQPVEYYEKIPENIDNPFVIILDPMLATGGSIVAAIDLLKKKKFQKIQVISVIASPEGIEAVQKAHPEVSIFTANIDECLNDHKYILPGLGDAGDRLFGTK